MMNRIIAGILILFFPLRLAGQLFTLTDQYKNNTLAINPAFSGCNDALSLTAIHRNQWTGFEGSPVISTISAHTPLHKDRIGLGLMVSDGSYGIFRETVITGNYAFRMEMSRGVLALGLGFGATLSNAAWNKLHPYDQGDQLLLNNPVFAVLPDVSIGAYYKSKRFFAGFSMPMMLSHEFDYTTGKYNIVNDFSRYSYFIEAGYYLKICNGVDLLPSVLINYETGKTPVLNYNAELVFKDVFRIGGGYREKDIVMGLMQINLGRQIMLAYSYDINLRTTSGYTDGTHEFALNYTFIYSRKALGPRQF
jgi:type IX secretion system PorP/SprF family membrane protein